MQPSASFLLLLLPVFLQPSLSVVQLLRLPAQVFHDAALLGG
ncbi:MAG: hypothetical protein ACE5IK_08790 [Acidobacteriota bacterium]